MLRRAAHGRGIKGSKVVGVAVGGPTLAAMALALGAPGSASAAPVPTPAPAAAPAAPVPIPPVGSVPVVGPLVAPAPVSSQPASPSPGPGSVKAQASGAQISVSPHSNLVNGERVAVSGSGFARGSAGGMAECNGVPNQPTQQVYGNAVPVGCTNPLQSLQATDANGEFNPPSQSGGSQQNFTIKTGTVGPPASDATDSSGGNAQADAAKYPCPPTPQQQAQGITCSISYGDASGNQASADLGFAASGSARGGGGNGGAATTTVPGSPVGSGSTAAGGSGGASGPSGATLGASDSTGGSATRSLPFTGFGVGMWRLALLGTPLSALGAGLIVLGHRPGPLARRLERLRRALDVPFGTVAPRRRRATALHAGH